MYTLNITLAPTLRLNFVFMCYHIYVNSEVTTENYRATPEPINPDEIEITVNYEPDPTDLVLSSVPGGELFDPRKHKFSEEDLKPQPMIKKAKKVLVPEEQKVCKGNRWNEAADLVCWKPNGKTVKQFQCYQLVWLLWWNNLCQHVQKLFNFFRNQILPWSLFSTTGIAGVRG